MMVHVAVVVQLASICLMSHASFCISLDSTTDGYHILRVHEPSSQSIFNQTC